MTDIPDFPALVELASRLEGKDRKVCELALYTLKKQDKRISKLQHRIDYLESILIDKEVRINELERELACSVVLEDK